MKFLMILISYMLLSCSHFRTTMNDVEKSQFDSYRHEFISKSNNKYNLEDIEHIDIYLVEYKYYNKISKTWEIDYGQTIGICYPLFFKTYIEINERWWYSINVSHLDRQQVIFHELGHCFLKRNHTVPTTARNISGQWERLLFDLGIFEERKKRYLDDLCPSSLMNPNTLDTKCFQKHYDYYIEELFK